MLKPLDSSRVLHTSGPLERVNTGKLQEQLTQTQSVWIVIHPSPRDTPAPPLPPSTTTKTLLATTTFTWYAISTLAPTSYFSCKCNIGSNFILTNDNVKSSIHISTHVTPNSYSPCPFYLFKHQWITTVNIITL